MNLTTLLALVSLVKELAPILAELIQIIEQTFPEPGNGTKKLEILRMFLRTMSDNAQEVEANMPTIERVVSWLVGAYNYMGKFRTGA